MSSHDLVENLLVIHDVVNMCDISIGGNICSLIANNIISWDIKEQIDVNVPSDEANSITGLGLNLCVHLYVPVT